MNSPNIMAEASIKALFFKYYWPILISMAAITIHQIINGLILGQQVGKEGVAAVGLYGPLVIAFISLSLPLTIGGGIMVGKSIGAQNHESAQKIFQFSTTIALCVGGAVALSTPFFLLPIAKFLAGSGNTALVKNASEYILYQFLGLPFFFLGMVWGSYISHNGAPKISRNASLVAVSSNIILDILFVIVLNLGVKGASIATMISLFLSSLYLFVYIKKGKSHFSIDNFRFTFKLQELPKLVSLGFPSFVSEISFSVGLLIINQSLIAYGALAISAFGIINYLSFFFLRLFTAAMMASLRIISFNLGARQPERATATLRFALIFTIFLGLLITTLGFVTPGILIKFLPQEETGEFGNLVSLGISLYFLLFLAAGPNYILSAYLQTIGKSIASSLINILKGFVMVGLLILVLDKYSTLGLKGIWLSRSFAEIFTLILVGGYTMLYRKNYYSKKAILQN